MTLQAGSAERGSSGWPARLSATCAPVVPRAADGTLVTDVHRVIVGVDDDQAGLTALAAATQLARSHGAPLVAVRAWALGLPRHGGRRMRHLRHPHVVSAGTRVGQQVLRAPGALPGGRRPDREAGQLTPSDKVRRDVVARDFAADTEALHA